MLTHFLLATGIYYIFLVYFYTSHITKQWAVVCYKLASDAIYVYVRLTSIHHRKYRIIVNVTASVSCSMARKISSLSPSKKIK